MSVESGAITSIDEINARLADVCESMRDRWDELSAQHVSDAEVMAGVGGAFKAKLPEVVGLTDERRRLRDGIFDAADVHELGSLLGWNEAEKAHAKSISDAGGVDYGDECIVLTHSGREIRCPAYPESCTYFRIVEQGFELAYWSIDEVAEAPAEVLGAIMGGLKNGVEVPEGDMLHGHFDRIRPAAGQRTLP